MDWRAFEWQVRTQVCSKMRKVMAKRDSSAWSLQGGVEVGWGAFECHLVLTCCASVSRGAEVNKRALQRGVEVGWSGSKRLDTYTLTAEAVARPDTVGIEHWRDFMGALKWGQGGFE